MSYTIAGHSDLPFLMSEVSGHQDMPCNSPLLGCNLLHVTTLQ